METPTTELLLDVLQLSERMKAMNFKLTLNTNQLIWPGHQFLSDITNIRVKAPTGDELMVLFLERKAAKTGTTLFPRDRDLLAV
jgi:hypothetical protein